jgi:hypothetical protein
MAVKWREVEAEERRIEEMERRMWSALYYDEMADRPAESPRGLMQRLKAALVEPRRTR